MHHQNSLQQQQNHRILRLSGCTLHPRMGSQVTHQMHLHRSCKSSSPKYTRLSGDVRALGSACCIRVETWESEAENWTHLAEFREIPNQVFSLMAHRRSTR